MNVLVIAAHPRDEVLACGGTIARLAADGHQVHVAIFGRDSGDVPGEETLVPELLCDAAALRLGAQTARTYGLPTGQFDAVPMLAIVRQLEALIDEVRPEVLYAPYGEDSDTDPVVLYRAVMTAVRPTRSTPVRRIYAFETPFPTRRASWQYGRRFEPNVYVDIQSTLAHKIEVARRTPVLSGADFTVRQPDTLRAVAGQWEASCGLQAAEAFMLIRDVQG